MVTIATARSLSVASGALAAAAWIVTMPAQAQSAAGKSQSDSPVLEEIAVMADRKGSYSAYLVQAGSFRGARQLDTPLTINVVPNMLRPASRSSRTRAC